MRTPESYEKAEVCKFLDSIGAWYCKPYMAGFGKRGVPDIIACIYGAFWGLEIKREGKKPTKLQEYRMQEIRRFGGHAVAGTAEVVIGRIKEWMRFQGAIMDINSDVAD